MRQVKSTSEMILSHETNETTIVDSSNSDQQQSADSHRELTVRSKKISAILTAEQQRELLLLVRINPNLTKIPSCLNYIMEDRVEAHKIAGIRNCTSLARLCKQLALTSDSDDTKNLVTRSFININDRNTPINNYITGTFIKSDVVETLSHGNVDSHCHPSSTFTVMQWNVLSEISAEDFAWNRRKWQLLFEISQYSPDVICLQELDRFYFLRKILSELGFDGKFTSKPDSPCNHLPNNTGPDGCAIFYNANRFNLLSTHSRVLTVKGIASNQVALMVKLECKVTRKLLTVTTTHLKARKSKLLEEVRYEQGKDVLRFVDEHSLSDDGDERKCASIITGDFNGDSSEKFYQYLKLSGKLTSAYEDNLPSKKLYPSNWTKRVNEPEIKQTVDFIFYSPNKLKVNALLSLNIPNVNQPLPNSLYPSDHLSLVSKFAVI